MSTEPTNSSSLLSAEELDVAIEEIEALGSDEAGIPSLDDGKRDKVVPIPIPMPAACVIPAEGGQPAAGAGVPAKPPAPRPEARSAEQTASRASGADAKTDAGAAKPGVAGGTEVPAASAGGVLHRLRGWLARGGRTPAAAPPDSSVQAASTSRLYRLLDKVLDLINRPFVRLSSETRQIIGLVGIATLIVALTVGYVVPLLMPRSDAFTFLEDKRAELLVAPADKPQDSAANDDDAP